VKADAVRRTVNMVRAMEGSKLLPVLVRLLAEGEPVAVGRLAAEGGWTEEDVRSGLARHPSVEWDDRGRIVGAGLTLWPTPHRFDFDHWSPTPTSLARRLDRSEVARHGGDRDVVPLLLWRSGGGVSRGHV